MWCLCTLRNRPNNRRSVQLALLKVHFSGLLALVSVAGGSRGAPFFLAQVGFQALVAGGVLVRGL